MADLPPRASIETEVGALDRAHHRLFVGQGGGNRILVFQLDANGLPARYTADYAIGQPSRYGRKQPVTTTMASRHEGEESTEWPTIAFTIALSLATAIACYCSTFVPIT